MNLYSLLTGIEAWADCSTSLQVTVAVCPYGGHFLAVWLQWMTCHCTNTQHRPQPEGMHKDFTCIHLRGVLHLAGRSHTQHTDYTYPTSKCCGTPTKRPETDFSPQHSTELPVESTGAILSPAAPYARKAAVELGAHFSKIDFSNRVPKCSGLL